jgi:HSP20 family protein
MAIPKRSRRHPLVELYAEFPERLRGDRWQPAADVFETATEIVVRFEVAGVPGEDLRVNLEESCLRLRGVRRAPRSGPIDQLQQMEISSGPFEREIPLEAEFDPSAVRARLENGLLEVRIAKKQTERRKVDVRSES